MIDNMKTLLTPLLLILFTLPSYASDLPSCPKGKHHTCYGHYTIPSGPFAGDIYAGEFKNEQFNGEGEYFTSGGKGHYVGNWKDGKRNGQGYQANSDGSKYVGKWKNNKYHGKGTYTFANGTVKSGIWDNGEYLYESVKDAKSYCAKKAGEMNNDFAAKKLYESCLADEGL